MPRQRCRTTVHRWVRPKRAQTGLENVKYIALIGLSGSGKSTVGPLLADALGLPFVDTDRETERAAGMPVNHIFEESGEAEFRRLEAEQVRRALDGPAAVVSLGGGAILDRLSRYLIWDRALVVWLRASPSTLTRRLEQASTEERPLLGAGDREAALRELLARRAQFYSAAHLQVDTTGKSPEQLVAEILRQLAVVKQPPSVGP